MVKTAHGRSNGQNKRMFQLAGQITQLAALFPEGVPDSVAHCGAENETIGRKWLRAACVEISRQPRSSALTSHQADRVIERLESDMKALQDAWQGIPTKEARTQGLVRPDQLVYIQKLVAVLARLEGRYQGMAGSPERMRHWCVHYLKVPWPQSMAAADVAIEALKSILTRSLPDPAALQEELETLVAESDQLTPWCAKFVADGKKRAQKWGPLQWAKLHEIFHNTLEVAA